MYSTVKKLIEVDTALVVKLKILSAFENLSVKALMEKAVAEYVHDKEQERLESLSEEEKEDLGLLLLMQQANRKETVTEAAFFKALRE